MRCSTQILHFVMYPFAEYALPMYSLDMVAFGVRLSHFSFHPLALAHCVTPSRHMYM